MANTIAIITNLNQSEINQVCKDTLEYIISYNRTKKTIAILTQITIRLCFPFVFLVLLTHYCGNVLSTAVYIIYIGYKKN